MASVIDETKPEILEQVYSKHRKAHYKRTGEMLATLSGSQFELILSMAYDIAILVNEQIKKENNNGKRNEGIGET
jgi:hypothetical protein